MNEIQSSIKPGDRWIASQRVTLSRSSKGGEWATHVQNMHGERVKWGGRYYPADDKTGGEAGAYMRALRDYLGRCRDLGVNPQLNGEAAGAGAVGLGLVRPEIEGGEIGQWDVTVQAILRAQNNGVLDYLRGNLGSKERGQA